MLVLFFAELLLGVFAKTLGEKLVVDTPCERPIDLLPVELFPQYTYIL